MKKLRKIWSSSPYYDIVNTKDLYFNSYQDEEMKYTFNSYEFYQKDEDTLAFPQRIRKVFSFVALLICIVTVCPIKWCITGSFALYDTKVGKYLLKYLNI